MKKVKITSRPVSRPRSGRVQGSCGGTPKRDGSGRGLGNRGKRK